MTITIFPFYRCERLAFLHITIQAACNGLAIYEVISKQVSLSLAILETCIYPWINQCIYQFVCLWGKLCIKASLVKGCRRKIFAFKGTNKIECICGLHLEEGKAIRMHAGVATINFNGTCVAFCLLAGGGNEIAGGDMKISRGTRFAWIKRYSKY